MNKRNFCKKPTSYIEQLNLLKKRGLEITDDERIIRYLKQISYYRLSAYFLPYQETKNIFNKNTHFDRILETYRFDRELRLLIFDNIERIEIAIRSQMVNSLAETYKSSHWQDIETIFKASSYSLNPEFNSPFNEFQRIIRKSCNSKKSRSIY